MEDEERKREEREREEGGLKGGEWKRVKREEGGVERVRVKIQICHLAVSVVAMVGVSVGMGCRDRCGGSCLNYKLQG